MQRDIRWIYRSAAVLLFVLLISATVVGALTVREHLRSLVEEEFD